jgi:thiamine biosynthesis lipoprotein ApbE
MPILRVAPMALALALLLPGVAAATTLRFAGQALGVPAEVELAGLDRAAAEAAAAAAFEELARTEAALRDLAERSARAAGGVFPLTGPDLELLERAQGFCLWSDGATGPLGGALYAAWGLRSPVAGRPGADRLAEAAATAGCARLLLDRAVESARLAPGSELELFPFAAGWAVDRAVAALTAAGAANGCARVGAVVRGFGAGADGRGWPVDPPAVPGLEEPLARFWLRDQAAALLTALDPPLLSPGERVLPYLDLRSGRPPAGIQLVIAVTDLAVDARALAQTMFALGARPGQLLLGSLRPAPAVLWLLGSGEGEPVLTASNWSRVVRR